ncbi:hypothetical protein BY458DRAFT_527176 [Sporodiniella umbellata]|nr:hypothetical protein BY458DRAFT_527176 [Sporodiniella umbellata]
MSAIQLSITSTDYKRKDPVFWIEAIAGLNQQKRLPRYYSELEKLYTQLSSNIPHTIIPQLPLLSVPRLDKEGNQVPRQWWLNLQAPMSTDSVEESKIQTWLNRIVENEAVQHSGILNEFTEKDIGYTPSSKILGIRTLSTFVPEKDIDPELNFWVNQLNSFSNELQLCLIKSNKLIQEHKMMADHWSFLVSFFVSYGALERDSDLFILYKSLTKGCQQICDLHRFQALSTLETVGNEISYQMKNVRPAQDAMQRRLDALSSYLSSKKKTESSLRSVERMRLSNSISREQANEAIVVLENARREEGRRLKHYEKLDENLREDIEYKYKSHVAQDLKKSLHDYATSQLYLERKKLLIWQDILVVK